MKLLLKHKSFGETLVKHRPITVALGYRILLVLQAFHGVWEHSPVLCRTSGAHVEAHLIHRKKKKKNRRHRMVLQSKFSVFLSEGAGQNLFTDLFEHLFTENRIVKSENIPFRFN